MMLKITLIICYLLAVGVLTEYLSDENLQHYTNFMKEQCKKNAGEDKYEQIKEAVSEYDVCVIKYWMSDNLDFAVLGNKSHSAFNDTIKRYCEKSSELKTCVHTLLDTVSPCFDANFRKWITAARNDSDHVIDFICYNDGERISVFIAEGGPECFMGKISELMECNRDIDRSIYNFTQFGIFTPTEFCAKYDEQAVCVVNQVASCSTPTPSKMAESLYKYIRKQSPCNTLLPKN